LNWRPVPRSSSIPRPSDEGGRIENGIRCGLGCVNLGRKGRAGVQLVQHALELGVGYFDTADTYGCGQSERVLGRALRHHRHEAFIATKGGYLFKDRSAVETAARSIASPWLDAARRHSRPSSTGTGGRGTAYGAQDFSPLYLRRAIEGSLRRLGTDFVDLYQLHGPDAEHDDVVTLMLDLQSEGKIGGFGVGLERLDHAEAWLHTAGISSIQIPFGVLDPKAGEDIIPRAGALGVGVVARGVFAGGFIARPTGSDMTRLRPGQPERLAALLALASTVGVDAMQLATWYVTARPGVSTVLIGTSSERHLSDAVRYLRTPPPEDVWSRLEALPSEESTGRSHADVRPTGGA
jgi:aryl-alcohol dehydrogenase-like predicted oxidoreductase